MERSSLEASCSMSALALSNLRSEVELGEMQEIVFVAGFGWAAILASAMAPSGGGAFRVRGPAGYEVRQIWELSCVAVLRWFQVSMANRPATRGSPYGRRMGF